MTEITGQPEEANQSGGEVAATDARAALHTRRAFLFKLSVLLNAAVGAVLAVPLVGYLLGPALKKAFAALTPLTALGIRLRKNRRFSSVAPIPPGTPRTNWKWSGAAIAPSLRRCATSGAFSAPAARGRYGSTISRSFF